jgi:hypothetical protein
MLWPKLSFSPDLEEVLRQKSAFNILIFFLLLAGCGVLSAQSTKAQLEVSETFFTIAAVLNSCGYDIGIENSLQLRQAVRADVQAAVQSSPQAAQARDAVCQFWHEHQPPGKEGDVGQYVSLALELGGPPTFAPVMADSDLPPDAAYVLGVVPLLQKFYQAAGLRRLWLKREKEYEALVGQFHDQVAKVITETDLYLKLPFSSSPGQRFVVYLEPMLAPTHVDSRNYGSNYFAVVSPGRDGLIRLPEIRHTYLHYVLDPMALRHALSMKRLEPILLDLRAAPMSKVYKDDISLLVDESLIRAIEARIAIPKSNEAGREAYVQHSVAEGFVLTHYFYEALPAFEKESTGMKDAYGDLLYNIDLDRERKRARGVQFATEATPEVVSASKAYSAPSLLDNAEQKMAMGDFSAAQKLAEQVVHHNSGGDEPGRAAFILARIASLSGNMEEAQVDFQQAVQSAHDPRTLAWSHIYLGRIYDIQLKREAALAEYQAALAAGDPTPDTKTAAERGLAAPYEARKSR